MKFAEIECDFMRIVDILSMLSDTYNLDRSACILFLVGVYCGTYS